MLLNPFSTKIEELKFWNFEMFLIPLTLVIDN